MAKNEAKIRFTAETKEFNESIKQANNEMAQMRAEMKLSQTQMDASGESLTVLSHQHGLMQRQLDASEARTAALSEKLNKAKEIFGANSDEVNKLKIQLTNAQTAHEKLRQAVEEDAQKLEEFKAAANKTESATEQLTNKIENQKSELDRLKGEYVEAVLQHGKYSSEARTLGKAIDDLSGDLKKNEAAMNEVEGRADDLDQTLSEVDETAEAVAEGFTVMKGAMADLVADGIGAVVDGFGEIASEAFTMTNDIDSATNTFIAKTGESKESAEEFEESMIDIYNGNYGESFEDISDSMSTIKTAMGDIRTEKLEDLTVKAIVLRDTFDMDVNESIIGANSMMDQFGITADEAYNLIAQGAQNGLNQNGDLLDVVNEYSVQFANAGFSAEEMFNMLANGTEAGTWSVDKLGDAVKEYNIRITDGTVAEAIDENRKQLGLTKDEVAKLTEGYGKGGDAGKEAMQKTLDAVLSVEDETERYKLGVQLFGTMWEDLGEDAVKALFDTNGELSLTKDALKEIDSVKYDDLGSAIEGIKRNLQTSITEPMKNEVMPAINEFIQDVDWQSVGQTIGEVFGTIVEGAFAIGEAIADAVGWMKEHQAVVAAVAAVVGILTTAITAYNIVQGIKAAMEAANVTTVWALVSAHIAQAAAAIAAVAPYVLIVAAIAAVIAIIVLCIKHWDDIVAAVKKAWEVIKETLSKWGEWINENVVQPIVKFFKNLWSGIKNIFSGTKEWFREKFAAAKEAIQNAWSSVKNFFSNIWSGVKNTFSNIKSWFSDKFNSAKNAIFNAWSNVTSKFTNMKNNIVNAFKNVKEKLSQPFEKARDAIKKVVDKIKGFFSGAKISWPKIPTPHFGISPAGWKVGDLLKGKIPKLSIDWYKDGGIFTKPTIFNTASGLKGVGEAGAEAVLPIDRLEGYIAGAIEKTMNVVNIDKLAAAVEDLASRPVDVYIGDNRVAQAIAGASDRVNGLRTVLQERGLVL